MCHRHAQVKPINRLKKVPFLNWKCQLYLLNICVFCSGATHCQFMHWLFPGSLDMSQVKFQAQNEGEFRHNYNLLQEAFDRSGITKVNT